MTNHKSYEEIHQLLTDASENVPLGSVRYHRKKPDVYYTVVDLIIDEATDAVAVVYQPVIQPYNIRFVRLLSIFLESPAEASTLQSRFVRVRF